MMPWIDTVSYEQAEGRLRRLYDRVKGLERLPQDHERRCPLRVAGTRRPGRIGSRNRLENGFRQPYPGAMAPSRGMPAEKF